MAIPKNNLIAIAGAAVACLMVASAAVVGTSRTPPYPMAPVPQVVAPMRFAEMPVSDGARTRRVGVERAPGAPPLRSPDGPFQAPFTTLERMEAWKALGAVEKRTLVRRCHGIREETIACLLPGVP